MRISFSDIGELIKRRADIETLKKIPDLIDDAAFVTQLKGYINRPF